MSPDASGSGPDDGRPWLPTPDGWPPAGPVRVPNDARELEPDRLAWLQEQADQQAGAPQERQRGGHVGWHSALVRRWSTEGSSGPLGALGAMVLVLVAAVGSLVVALVPRLGNPPAPGRLATVQAAPGRSGGLLPDTRLRTLSGGSFALRSIRPAVVAVVGARCECLAALRAVHAQAEEFSLRLLLVAPRGAAAETLSLARAADVRVLDVAEDVDGALGAYPSSPGAPTLLVVQADGVVRHVLTGATGDSALEPLLTGLLPPRSG